MRLWTLLFFLNSAGLVVHALEGPAIKDHTQSTKTRVFVYEREVYDLSRILSCARKCPKVGYNSGLYDMEYYVKALFSEAPGRAFLEEDADFYFVPVYANMHAVCVGNATNRYMHNEYLWYFNETIKQITRLPTWKERNGADHIFVVTPGFASDIKHIFPALQHAIILTSYKPINVHYTVDREIVIPAIMTAYSTHVSQTRARLTSFESRTLLAAFKGKIRKDLRHSHGVRQRLIDLFGSSTVISIDNNPNGDFTAAIEARFCLCPPGYFNWTARPVEAIYNGCVPVIIGRQSLAFEDIIDWSELSVSVSFEDLPNLQTILQNISLEEGKRLQKKGTGALKFLFFDHTIQQDFPVRNRGFLYMLYRHLSTMKFW